MAQTDLGRNRGRGINTSMRRAKRTIIDLVYSNRSTSVSTRGLTTRFQLSVQVSHSQSVLSLCRTGCDARLCDANRSEERSSAKAEALGNDVSSTCSTVCHQFPKLLRAPTSSSSASSLALLKTSPFSPSLTSSERLPRSYK